METLRAGAGAGTGVDAGAGVGATTSGVATSDCSGVVVSAAGRGATTVVGVAPEADVSVEDEEPADFVFLVFFVVFVEAPFFLPALEEDSPRCSGAILTASTQVHLR